MYKVIIADDHMPVIDFLTAKIPWEELGLRLLKACSDGKEALSACKAEPPDLLITDIGMPEMDGLELIEASRQINTHLKSVVLSCHEDFHYAQQAVKLNVTDYILKETLQIEQLTDILRHLIQQLDKEKAEQMHSKTLQEVFTRSRSSLQTEFLRSLLDSPVWNMAEWTAKAGTLGIPVTQDVSYLPVLCMLDRYQEFELRFGGSHQLHFVIENALNEAATMEGCVVLALTEKHYFILYPYPRTLSRNVMECIKDDLHAVRESLGRWLKIKTSYYFADTYASITELKAQISLLLKGRDFRFYSGENQILRLQPFMPATEDIFVCFAEALHDFSDCIVTANAEEIRQIVNKWMEHVSTQKYPAESVLNWIFKIVTDMELKYAAKQHFLTNYNAEMLQRSIHAIDTLTHLTEWLTGFLLEKKEFMRSRQQQTMRKEVAAAQKYVLTNLHEKISMEEIAVRLEMNPSHFSRIFKKETGQTFVEFVTAHKMERAAELLDKSNKTVDEVAQETGFENTSYFFKLFRSFTGMTPTEYRKR